MLVIHNARGLIEILPPAFPGHETKIGIFEVKGRQERVESAELEKFSAVKGAGAAATVEAWVKSGDVRIDSMANPQTTVLPPSFRESSLFSQFFGIRKKD